ncbi:MAG: translesion DNA synthesis-associated protein ImuA [Thalassolituus sp.]
MSSIHNTNTLGQHFLRGQVWRGDQIPELSRATVLDTGHPELNRELPAQGWRAGQVCEIYSQSAGCGEVSLLLPALAKLSQQERWIMLIAPPAIPYAPALSMAGINTRHLLMVHPANHKEALWCIEEGLRSGQCSAVLGWLNAIDNTSVRRIQLACEEQQNYCWLWPGQNAGHKASAAPLRMNVRRHSAREAAVQFIKRRGSWPSNEFLLPLWPVQHN